VGSCEQLRIADISSNVETTTVILVTFVIGNISNITIVSLML